jgi:hypothetical protein
MLGFSFREMMEGTAQRDGERFDRPFRFDFDVRAPRLLGFFRTVVGEAKGRVRLDGLAKDAQAKGTLELSPFAQKRIRYQFQFQADDGRGYRFDGHKTIDMLKPLAAWTTLPGTIFDSDGRAWGTATLRFSFQRHFAPLLSSFRIVRHAERVAHG